MRPSRCVADCASPTSRRMPHRQAAVSSCRYREKASRAPAEFQDQSRSVCGPLQPTIGAGQGEGASRQADRHDRGRRHRLQCGDGALTRKRAAPPSRTDARDRGSLRCCHAAREVIDLAAVASAKGNLNVIDNAGVAALAAYAALRSAALNGYTNGKMISDKAFAEAELKEWGIGAEGVTEGSLRAGEEQAELTGINEGPPNQ